MYKYKENEQKLQNKSATNISISNKQKLKKHIHQLHLQCAHKRTSTWNYIQDVVNNQLHTMAEKTLRNIGKEI